MTDFKWLPFLTMKRYIAELFSAGKSATLKSFAEFHGRIIINLLNNNCYLKHTYSQIDGQQNIM